MPVLFPVKLNDKVPRQIFRTEIMLYEIWLKGNLQNASLFILFKFHAQERKGIAITNMQNQKYQRSIKDFHFALLLHPDDGSKMKFKRSVESHLANVYFKLKQYNKAVQLGEESYKSNSYYRSKVL